MTVRRRDKWGVPAALLVCATLFFGAGCEGPAGAPGKDGAAGAKGADGKDGAAGKDGASLVWKGTLPAAPTSPEVNWAYYNSKDSVVYIYAGAASGWDTLIVGIPGPAGAPGKDGTVTNLSCMKCHNDTTLLVQKQMQVRLSLHSAGENAAYANRMGCVQCHTSEGFVQSLGAGVKPDSVPALAVPTQINCRTCHRIHESYDTTDFVQRKVTPVKFMTGTATYDFGNANLCANCHQSRAINPKIPALTLTSADSLSLTSTRWGPHHGPQSNVTVGVGGGMYEIPGSMAYPTTSHGGAKGCIACHMAKPYGNLAGGHNMSVTYDAHGVETDLTTGCAIAACHSDAAKLTAAKASTRKTTDSLMAVLKEKLASAGVIDTTVVPNLLKKGISSTAPLKLSAPQAGIVVNYITIQEDRSRGLHNPAFVKALLTNSIEGWK